MDLTISPDLAAYICYGIVLLLGIVVAVSQVNRRLEGITGVWSVPHTWLLFLAYVAVPVVLYWLLDRTGAIADTSLFAAVLIGVGYERIIAGGDKTIPAPADVSAFWTPFLAYANKVAKLVYEQSARNEERLAEKIIAGIMKVQARFDSLEALALAKSSDVVALRAQLDAIDRAPGSGDSDKLEKKARHLYSLLLPTPDLHYLLINKGVIEVWWYRMQMCTQLLRGIVIAIVIVGGLIFVGSTYVRDPTVSYHVWRLGKMNSTDVDQYRSRRHLVVLMEQADRLQKAVDQLIYLVQRPGLPMERVDLILQTLLERRTLSGNKDLPRKLVEALRADSLDARTRINDVLIFLSASCARETEKSLREWKPTERDSSTTLEEKISAWSRHWEQCGSQT